MTPNTTTISGFRDSPFHTTSMSFDHRAWLIAVVVWVLLMLALIASCMRNHLHARGPAIFCRLSQYLHRTIGWITNDERLWNKVLKHFRTLRLGSRWDLRFPRMRRHRRRSAQTDLETGFVALAAGASGLKQPTHVAHSNELIDLVPSKTSSSIHIPRSTSTTSVPLPNNPLWWNGSALTITERRQRSV